MTFGNVPVTSPCSGCRPLDADQTQKVPFSMSKRGLLLGVPPLAGDCWRKELYKYCPRFDSVSIALLALDDFPVTSVRM
jgi:hypothetical protein